MFSIKLLILVCTFSLYAVVGGSYEEQTTFTSKELAAIRKLKQRILPNIPPKSYVNEFIKDDLYVVRWLRAKNGDFNGAYQLFSDHLKWRQIENMDNVEDEDWSDMERDFPIFTDGWDKKGQPVCKLWFSEWQTRRAVIAGKLKRVVKWVARMFEVESRKLYTARAAGEKVSQAVMLLHLEGFSVLQQGCPSCLPVYVGTTSYLENHYPGMFESINLIDMPSSFEIILRLIRPVMKPATRKALKVYASEAEWKPALDEKIDQDQRSIRFGGTVTRQS